MTLMKWSEHFLTGIELVDSQHHRLVELVNAVSPTISSNQSTTDECLMLIDRLTDYAATHFRDEERYMLEGGLDNTPHIDEHIREHLGFVEEVARMRRQFAADGTLDGEQTLRFFASWLTFHILVQDQEMARELQRRADGVPEKLPAGGEQGRNCFANRVLVETLTELFNTVTERNRTLVRINAKLTSAQERLAELNGTLEKQIEERTLELRQTNAELLREQVLLQRAMDTIERTHGQLLQSEKMAAVGQLAAGVAHEINNPIGFVSSNLGSLKTYVDALLDVVDVDTQAIAALASDHPARLATERAREQADLDYLREDIPNLLNESAEGLARVRKIVADLKDFSRADDVEMQDADLNQLLESTLNVVANELKYKAIVVRDFGDLPSVRCCATQINQVFMNLLVNAGQAIDDAGTITLRSGHEAPFVWVEVEDTGKGMSPDVRKRLFQPFFTTKPMGKGTGLGLSISRDIVQRHGGTISVDSAPGNGARFLVRLPVNGPDKPVEDASR